MSCVWCWVERGLRRRDVNVTGGTGTTDEVQWGAVWWVAEITGAEACQSWRVRRVSVVQSSGDVRYRVNSMYCMASKAGSGLMYEWMLRTARSGVSVTDMQGGQYVRSCEQEMSQVRRSHELREWGVAMPRYSGSHLFGVLGDGAELGDTYRHDKQVLWGTFEVMVQQRGVVAVT